MRTTGLGGHSKASKYLILILFFKTVLLNKYLAKTLQGTVVTTEQHANKETLPSALPVVLGLVVFFSLKSDINICLQAEPPTISTFCFKCSNHKIPKTELVHVSTGDNRSSAPSLCPTLIRLRPNNTDQTSCKLKNQTGFY